MKHKFDNPRIFAVLALEKINNGAYSNIQLDSMFNKWHLSVNDKNLATNIVYGVIQHKLTLEYWLAPFIEKKKVDSWVKTLLYTAIYQQEYLNKIPKHAIFNETIEVANILGHKGVSKFVTAILHKIDREGLVQLETIKDDIQRLSIQYSLPDWIVNNIVQQVGEIKAISIFESLNLPPKQSVRINTRKTSVDDFIAKLKDYKFENSKVYANALRFSNSGNLANSSFYQDGLITIQDESAMLPVDCLSQLLKEKQTDQLDILDAAAAPGGKTTQLAELFPNAHITALDIHDHKLKLINDNAARLGVKEQIETKNLDARKLDQLAEQTFDCAIVDVPCSGLGLLRRKPEIRYEKKEEDIASLSKIQLDILNAVCKKIRHKGIIIYSTCTVMLQENDQVILEFLKKNPEFEQIKVQTGKNLKSDRSELDLHIYPDDYLTDGFYVAALKRK